MKGSFRNVNVEILRVVGTPSVNCSETESMTKDVSDWLSISAYTSNSLQGLALDDNQTGRIIVVGDGCLIVDRLQSDVLLNAAAESDLSCRGADLGGCRCRLEGECRLEG